jgi:large subunit ribosomal protein L18
MLSQIDREARRRRVKRRIRQKISGTAERPRLFVHRTTKHFYAQAVDDAGGRTLCSASTLDKDVRGKQASGGNVAAAKAVGEVMAERLKEQGIQTVVFDRGGRIYHGRVRAAAEALRKQGIQF